MIDKNFEDILAKLSELLAKQSVAWYLSQVKSLSEEQNDLNAKSRSFTTSVNSKYNPQNDVRENIMAYQFTFTDIAGRVVFFRYDAKTKAKLPYWDMYPIVIPLYPGGVSKQSSLSLLGLNLHYLPPYERARFFTFLQDLRNNTKNLDENTRIRVRYKTLQAASKYRYFKPCIKRYLLGHVKTRIALIKPEDWDKVILMPLQRFQKQSQFVVWSGSIKMINAKR